MNSMPFARMFLIVALILSFVDHSFGWLLLKIFVFIFVYFVCWVVLYNANNLIHFYRFYKIKDCDERIRKIEQFYKKGYFCKFNSLEYESLMFATYFEKGDYENALKYARYPYERETIASFWDKLFIVPILIFLSILEAFKIPLPEKVKSCFVKGDKKLPVYVTVLPKEFACYLKLNKLIESREILNTFVTCVHHDNKTPAKQILFNMDYYYAQQLLAEKKYDEALLYIDKLKAYETPKVFFKVIRVPGISKKAIKLIRDIEKQYESEMNESTAGTYSVTM